MKILHVMNDFPYPPNHGGRVDMWGRLLTLVDSGFEVDAVVTLKARPLEREVDRVRKMVNKLYLVERRSNLTGLLNSSPVQVCSREGLRNISLRGHYDCALGESEFSFPIFENMSLNAERKVLRIHNDESRFMRERAHSERNWFKWLYYMEESRRFLAFSRKAYRAVDQIWFSSADQYSDYMRMCSDDGSKAAWLPPPVDFSSFVSPSIRTSKQVLFAGTLSAISNIEAIDWYLSGVHPELKRIEGYRFVIAGNTRGKPLSPIIKRAATDERCSVITDVDNLSSIYEESAVFVNSMVRGASIKIKTIDAVVHGLPVVSTTVGNEGTGLVDVDHLHIANTDKAFVNCIEMLLSSPRAGMEMTERAQDFLRSQYRHAEQIGQLLGGAKDKVGAH